MCHFVLVPQLRETRHRAEEAVLDAKAARAQLAQMEGRMQAMRVQLENAAPQMLSLEARKGALEIELSGARREILEVQEENSELMLFNEEFNDPRSPVRQKEKRLEHENSLLRELNGHLRQQFEELQKQVAGQVAELEAAAAPTPAALSRPRSRAPLP